jgi:uncharacterized membrane protein
MLIPDRAQKRPLTLPALWALTLGLLALVLGVWLTFTPPGLLGKADAVGYAICHRIDLRSFHLGDRQLPLCARCTGIYLGVVFGLAGMAALGRSRAGALPPRAVLLVLIGFMALMGVDGLNSYVTLFPGLPHLYEPANWLRLVTGAFNGLTVSALIYPVFNQTLWLDWQDRPALASFRDLAVLAALMVIVIGLVLTENPIVLYPLALLSALGVVVLLTMLYTIGVLLVSRSQNTLQTWKQAALPLAVGLTLAIAQVGALDAVRYAAFGTWSGFPFGR